MKKEAKRKRGSKATGKTASTSSASKNQDAMVETQPGQEAEEAAKVESPTAKEAENEEEPATVNKEEEEEQTKPDSSTQQEEDQNDEAKGASSSQPQLEENQEEAKENEELEEEQPKSDSSTQQEKDHNDEAKGASSSHPQVEDKKKPLRRGKRKRSANTETDKNEETTPVTRGRAKRARETKPQEPETEYFKEKRNLEDLWKAAFPVGTEWDQLDALYEFNWDFTNVEAALEEGGKLYGKKVYVFGCTEPHSILYKKENKTILVPAVVCVESSIPPSDKIGITAVQSEAEEIIPMKDMKMAWVPYIPLEKRDIQVDRMNFQIFILGCTQRRSALKHLKEDRVKKFNYCLPYIYNPFKEDESEQSTVVHMTFPSEPPVVCEYDWEKNNIEEFTNDLIIDEALPLDKKDEFKEFVKEQCDNAKKSSEEAKQARYKVKQEMSEETKEAYKEMKLYKFYPLPSPDTPTLSKIDKSSFINRYFGQAHEVD